jgi:hypothetical protein
VNPKVVFAYHHPIHLIGAVEQDLAPDPVVLLAVVDQLGVVAVGQHWVEVAAVIEH